MHRISHLTRSPGVRNGATLALAVGSYGISFGALAVTSGLSVLEACLLSLLMFTGGSQFALIGVISGGGTPVAAFGAASLLGIRNAVYGMQMNSLLRPRTWAARLGLAQITIDESTAVALGQTEPIEQRRGFLTAGIGIFILWNATTALGAVIGDALGDPRAWGLDGAAVAAFLALLWPRLKGRQPWAIAAACAAATVLLIPAVPQGLPIVVAAVVAIAMALLTGRGSSTPSRVRNEHEMELILWILAACALAYLIKLSGYLIPAEWLDRPIIIRLAAATTIGLLASLVAVNTVGSGQSLVADARLLALGAAAVALLLRAPFIVVVIVGTAAAAGGRLLGLQ